MTIAAAQISADALHDMIELFNAQPWTKNRHEELTELWNICISRDQQLLIKDLINNFFIFDYEHEENSCNKFNTQIHNWGLQPSKTWIVAVANKSEVDGSTAALQKLKNKVLPYEDWHSRFLPNIPEAAEKIKNNANVVLFDDFLGTGNKMVRKVEWIKKLLNDKGIKNINFFCACFSGMEFGIQHIQKTLGIPIFTANSLKRGISERYTGNQLERAVELMKQIEEQLNPNYKNKKLSEYTFGYKKSEALYYAINDNCPNNVFPIFWWPIKKNKIPFKTMLRRAG